MTDTDDSTMAASEAAGTAFKQVECKNKSKRLKTTLVARIPVQRAHKYTICAYFLMPRANTKFNPIASMRLFFKEMLNYDSMITVINTTDDQQLQLAHDIIPTSEVEFKKYFTVTNDTRPIGMPPHVIIGCFLMSDQTMCDIKFDTMKTTKFINWLKKERIFIKSDSLGIAKTTTIGYLTKIHPKLTNRTFLKPLLLEVLEDVAMDPSLACKLDPSLSQQQTKAMSNGDVFAPEPPPFELYQTRISCGKDKDKIKTDIIGIKCAIDKGCLLKELFNQSGLTMELDTCMGTFVPTGAVHLIGLEAYAKLLRDHNQFLHTVTMVPIGDFQHETLELPFSTDATTDIEVTDLLETILSQPWCLSLERSTTPNKVILITTLGNISTAQNWVDITLLDLYKYKQHILTKLNVTTLLPIIPRHLDKPILTSASQTYASQLKQSMTSVTSVPTKQNPLNCPPRSRFVKPVDIMLAEAATQKPACNQQMPMATTETPTANTPISNPAPFDYQAELQKLSKEVETTLQAKFDAVFNKLQKSIDTMDEKMDHKIQHHMEQLKSTQADRATQENHSKQLEMLTKMLKILVRQMSTLLDQHNAPTPMNGIGEA